MIIDTRFVNKYITLLSGTQSLGNLSLGITKYAPEIFQVSFHHTCASVDDALAYIFEIPCPFW